MARSLKRWWYVTHRWLGIALCLLFAMWFVSGVVMMYVAEVLEILRTELETTLRLLGAPQRFSAYSATVVTRFSRSGRKPGAMPGMLKKCSVLKSYGSTVLTVVDKLLGKRVCRFTLTSSPKAQSLRRPARSPWYWPSMRLPTSRCWWRCNRGEERTTAVLSGLKRYTSTLR